MMCRFEIRVFSLGIVFSTVLRTPLDLHFDVHYTLSGVPLASFGAPLGALLGPCWSHWALVGRPLGLSKRLWVGLVLTL